MKKIILPAIVVILAGIIFAWFYLRPGAVDEHPASFLAEDTFIYLEQKNLEQVVDDLTSSRLGKAVAGIDFVSVARELDEPQESIDEIESAIKAFDDALNDPIYRELFGSEVVLALPAVSLAMIEDIKIEGELLNTLIFIAKPKHAPKMLEKLAGLFAGDIKQTTVTYGKYTIRRYEVEPGVVFATVIVGGYIIVSMDETRVQQCLDVYDAGQGSLLDNENFSELQRSLPETDLFTYMAIEKISVLLHKALDTFAASESDDLQRGLAYWQGWKAAGYGAWREESAVKDKAVVLYDRENLAPLMKRMLDLKPDANKQIALVSPKALIYYWTNTFDSNLMWDTYKQDPLITPEGLQTIRGTVEGFTGVPLEDLLSMFGNEFAFALKDKSVNGVLPLPNAVLYLQLQDKTRFVAMVEDLLKKSQIPVQKTTYKNVSLTYWGVSAQGDMQPVYAVVDNYCLVSSNIAFVKEIIDGLDTGENLLQSKDFQQVSAIVNGTNNSSFYIHFSALIGTVKELIGWGSTMLTVQDPDSAKDAAVIVEKILNPLLDGLAMYSIIGSRSAIEKDRVVLEASTVVEQ